MRRLLIAAMLFALLLPAVAVQAKDFKSNTAVENGYVWMFAYDDRASSIKIDPALCYGVTLFQIIDFDWARNMVAELNYLYADMRGEQFGWQGGDSNLFDLRMHQIAFNPGYMFEGRRLHPYFSGGLGVTAFLYEDRLGERITEQDLTVNLGGGAEYTLWETGMAALERLDLGIRLRYYYFFEEEIVNTALSGLSITIRLNLRW